LFLCFIASSHMQKPAIEANDTYGFSYFKLGLHNFCYGHKNYIKVCMLEFQLQHKLQIH